MDGLEFRPEPLPESLPLRQTRPRPRSDVNGHLNQEGWPVAVRRQSVEPDRQVAAVAGAEAQKFINRCAMGWGRCMPRGHGASRIQSLRTFRTVIRIQSLVELLDSGGI